MSLKTTDAITGYGGSGIVLIGGKILDMNPSLKLRNHSPTGFAWGYGGSGPSQLALAILLEVTDEESALRLYQQFKWDVVSRLKNNFSLNVMDVVNWVGKTKVQDSSGDLANVLTKA
jgi:hypothetical protein